MVNSPSPPPPFDVARAQVLKQALLTGLGVSHLELPRGLDPQFMEKPVGCCVR